MAPADLTELCICELMRYVYWGYWQVFPGRTISSFQLLCYELNILIFLLHLAYVMRDLIASPIEANNFPVVLHLVSNKYAYLLQHSTYDNNAW